MTTTLAKTIAELIKIRDTAHEDLLAASEKARASEWGHDRRDDILRSNRELKRLGAIPAWCATG